LHRAGSRSQRAGERVCPSPPHHRACRSGGSEPSRGYNPRFQPAEGGMGGSPITPAAATAPTPTITTAAPPATWEPFLPRPSTS
jgi:hypothetical protein